MEFQDFKHAKGSSAEDDKAKMDKFETSMGVILKNAWMHVEALQTTDLPLLVKYISSVMQQSSSDGLDSVSSLGNRAEAMVIHYLHGICKRLDEIDEGRIMPFILEEKVLPSAAAHLHKYYTKMSEDDIIRGAQALAIICDSEDFGMHPEQYISSNHEKRTLVNLKDDFLADLVADDIDIRRSVRPLLDQIDKAERDLPSK